MRAFLLTPVSPLRPGQIGSIARAMIAHSRNLTGTVR